MNRQTLKGIILVGLFAVPFVPFLVYSGFFFPFITSKAFAWRLIVEVIFAAWILLALVDSNYQPKKSFILYAILAFLAVIGLADLFGAASVKSFWSNFERMEGFITLLHLGAFFLVMSSVFNEALWKKWWHVSLATSFIMVLYASLQVFRVTDPSQAGTRVDGTFGNTIYLAVYMLFHIFLALYFLLRERVSTGWKWTYSLLIISQIFILYNTATRGAILGFLGGFLIVAILNLWNRENSLMRKTSIAGLVSIVVLVAGFWGMRNSDFVLNNPVLARFATLTTEDLRTQGRYFVWPIALEGVKDRPILGWGQENFNFVFQEYYRPDMHHLEPWFDRAHNIFLDWAIAGGILGLLAYLSLYGALMLLVWRNAGFSFTEKSILTGLVAAYFFHNFFVFDHLISYVLFFSLLAYIHSKSLALSPASENSVDERRANMALPVVILVFASVLYFVNIGPYLANTRLLQALSILQNPQGDVLLATESFKSAYGASRLGRTEMVEQMTVNSPSILGSANLSIEEKNDFFLFVQEAVEKEARTNPNDARAQLLAGSFFATTGHEEKSIEYLEKAREIVPNKQQVYFELGRAHLLVEDFESMLLEFGVAYELDPSYREARIYYLLGSIYASDRALESEIKSLIGEESYVFDDRVASAYYELGRISDVRAVLLRRIELDPANTETYQEVLDSLSN